MMRSHGLRGSAGRQAPSCLRMLDDRVGTIRAQRLARTMRCLPPKKGGGQTERLISKLVSGLSRVAMRTLPLRCRRPSPPSIVRSTPNHWATALMASSCGFSSP